jgi:hypothetical protein
MEEIKETYSPPVVEQEKERLSTAAKIGIAVGAIVVVALLLLALYYLVTHPDTTETVRDLFIIFLALESLAIGTLLVILTFQLIMLIRLLRDDIKPMLESTQETMNTVKGTANFVSDQVTKPAIAASGYFSGVARSVSVLLDMLPRNRNAKPGGGESKGE